MIVQLNKITKEVQHGQPAVASNPSRGQHNTLKVVDPITYLLKYWYFPNLYILCLILQLDINIQRRDISISFNENVAFDISMWNEQTFNI